MTPLQTLAVAFIGGLAALFSIALCVGLALLAMSAWDHLSNLPEAYRTRRERLQARRKDFDTCRAIDALPARTPDE
ncbi:hypothetical protein [Streptomyces sp. NPDC005281]|uniref:hypothetical protein n=1 Tax=Streptomyces sp. NPDC005281 TaxID=3155712 RepID=UPI00339FB56F